MDTLRGSLDTFGLPDIVQLIASSDRTGVLTAETFRLKGRIFIADGAINYATTRGDDGDIEELRKMTTSRALRRERRGRKESSPGQTLDDLVEQQVVEVFVRLMRMSGGKFVFDEGARTKAFGNGTALSLEVGSVIDQARGRIAEWEDIETVVPAPSTRFSLNRDLGDEEFEVTLDARSWTFLAAIGDAASVQDLAERLRIFEFPAAKKVAEFVRRGLLVPTEPRVDTATVPVTLTETTGSEPAAVASGEGDETVVSRESGADDAHREHHDEEKDLTGADASPGEHDTPQIHDGTQSAEDHAHHPSHPEPASQQALAESPPPPPGHDGGQ